MQVAVLQNYDVIGKLHSGKHFSSGVVKHFNFTSISELGKIIKGVAGNPKQCLSVGTFDHNGKVVPRDKVNTESDMMRTKSDMKSGNILVIDNDTQQEFDPSIFKKHWKFAFKNAGYVRTKSGSTILGKKKNGTHDYFILDGDYNDVKHAMEILEAICIVEGHYIIEHQATGRAVIKTPIDIKLNEIQMLIYEDDTNPVVTKGGILDIGTKPKKYDMLMTKALKIKTQALEKVIDKSLKLHKIWLKENQKIKGLSDKELLVSFGNYERRYVNEATKLFVNKKCVGVVADLLTGKLTQTLFADLFEPDYGGGSQKARFYNAMFHSQAHGGVNYYIRVSEKWARANHKILGNLAVDTKDIDALQSELSNENIRLHPKLVERVDDINDTYIGAYLQSKNISFWDGTILQYEMLEKICNSIKMIDGVLTILPALTHPHLVGKPAELSKRLATLYPLLQDMNVNGDLQPVDTKGIVLTIKTALEICSTTDSSNLNHIVQHEIDCVENVKIIGTALIKTLPINKPTLISKPKKPKVYKKIVKELKKTAIGNAADLLKYSLACKILPQKKQFLVDSSVSNSMKSTLIMGLSKLGLLKEVQPDSLLKRDTNKTAPDQFPKYWLLAFDDTVKVFKDTYYEIKARMPFAMAYGKNTIDVNVPVIYVGTADGLKGLSEQRQNRTFDLDVKNKWSGNFQNSDIQASVDLYLFALASSIYDDLKIDPINVASKWISEIQGKYSEATISSTTILTEEIEKALMEYDFSNEFVAPQLKAIRYFNKDGYLQINRTSSPSSLMEELYTLSGNKLKSNNAVYEFTNITWDDLGAVLGLVDKHKGLYLYYKNGRFIELEFKGVRKKPSVLTNLY